MFLMVRRRACAVSNREFPATSFESRPKMPLIGMREAVGVISDPEIRGIELPEIPHPAIAAGVTYRQ